MISYKPFKHLLIERDLMQKDVAALAGVHVQTLSKMSRGESITLDVVDRICVALGCKITDVVEIILE